MEGVVRKVKVNPTDLGSGYLSLRVDPLHRTSREVRQDDRERFGKISRDGVNNGQLLKEDLGGMETSEEDD